MSKKYVVLNDCGAYVCGYNSILQESIVTRIEADFKFFDSKESAQKFIDKCFYEDDFEIKEWKE